MQGLTAMLVSGACAGLGPREDSAWYLRLLLPRQHCTLFLTAVTLHRLLTGVVQWQA
jgi:hypothetical protein